MPYIAKSLKLYMEGGEKDMDYFNIGNLVGDAVGGVAMVATSISGEIAAAASAIAAIATTAIAKVNEDGDLSIEEAEELFEEIFKTLVGAYISAFGSVLGNNDDSGDFLGMGLGSVRIDKSKLGTGKVGDFNGLKDPTLDEILSRIPSDATDLGFTPEPGRMEDGFKMGWKD